MRTSLIFAILVLCMLQNACTRTLPKLPNTISPYECAVYSAWLTSHLEHERDRAQEILIEGHTIPVMKNSERCQLPKRLLQPLLNASDAQYPIHNTPTEHITAPFEFRLVDIEPRQPTKSYELISFTRIAFTADHSEGLFWVWSDHGCRKLNGADGFECGGGRGRFVRVIKTGSHWDFRAASPCVSLE